MAQKRPPKHRIDSPIVYIPPGDDAWDLATIEAERKAMMEAGEKPDLHPVTVYYSGETRFDLSAPAKVLGDDRCPAQYLLDGKKPERFKLRRLSYEQFQEVQQYMLREEWVRGQGLA